VKRFKSTLSAVARPADLEVGRYGRFRNLRYPGWHVPLKLELLRTNFFQSEQQKMVIPGVNPNVILMELAAESGRSVTVQTKTNLANGWLDWTNVTGAGVPQLLPLSGLTNQSPRYFRAFAQ
jgi:hypothetical protein